MEGEDDHSDSRKKTPDFRVAIIVFLVLIGLGIGVIVNVLIGVLGPEAEFHNVLESPLKHQTICDYPSALALVVFLFLLVDFARQPKTPKRLVELSHRSEDVAVDAKRISRIIVIVLQYSLLLLAGVWVFFVVWAVKAITTITLVWNLRRTPGFRIEVETGGESAQNSDVDPSRTRFAFERGFHSGMQISGYPGLALSLSLLVALGHYHYIILILIIAGMFLAPFLYHPTPLGRGGRRARLFMESAVPRIGLGTVMAGIGMIRGEWIWIVGFLVISATLCLWIVHLFLLVREEDLTEQVEELSMRLSLPRRASQTPEGLRVIVSVPAVTVVEPLTRIQTSVLGIGLTLFLAYATLSRWIWPSGSLVTLYTATLAVHVGLTVTMASIGGLFSSGSTDARVTGASGTLPVRGILKGLSAISAIGILLSFAGLVGNLALLSGGIKFGVLHFSAAWDVGLVNRFVLLFTVAVMIEIAVQLIRLIKSR
jgi:hypothetical protein